MQCEWCDMGFKHVAAWQGHIIVRGDSRASIAWREAEEITLVPHLVFEEDQRPPKALLNIA